MFLVLLKNYLKLIENNQVIVFDDKNRVSFLFVFAGKYWQYLQTFSVSVWMWIFSFSSKIRDVTHSVYLGCIEVLKIVRWLRVTHITFSFVFQTQDV